MTVAINTSLLYINQHKNFANYIHNVFELIIKQNTTHNFIFIVNKEFENSFDFNISNYKKVIVKQTLKSQLQLWYFNKIVLPKIIKKNNCNILVETNNVNSNIKIDSILITENGIFKINKNTKSIICFSNYTKQNIVTNFKINDNAISIIKPATTLSFKPLNFNQTQQIKDGFADGREYFLLNASGSSHQNLMTVLKAFSIFKKWQNSNMKLLVTNYLPNNKNNILNKLDTYKHKADTVFLNHINEENAAKIIASAYCVIYLPLENEITIPILQAMQCNVAVITNNLDSLQQELGNALLYANVNLQEDIAQQMKLIYKDEILRSNLIKLSNTKVAAYNLQNSATQLWSIILKNINTN